MVSSDWWVVQQDWDCQAKLEFGLSDINYEGVSMFIGWSGLQRSHQSGISSWYAVSVLFVSGEIDSLEVIRLCRWSPLMP